MRGVEMGYKEAPKEDLSVIYGLDYQARSLTSRTSDSEKAEFIIGTQSLKFDNHVYILEFDEETSQIWKKSYSHRAGEIWSIAAYPADRAIISTCYVSVSENKCKPGCSLWQFPPADTQSSDIPVLKELCSVDTTAVSSIAGFNFQPTNENPKALLTADNQLYVFDVNLSGFCEICRTAIDSKVGHKLGRGKWNPHFDSNTLAVACDSVVKGFDIRSKQFTFTLENVHSPTVRDLDFNRNRSYILATGGDDGKVKIWDTRSVAQPLLTIAKHSHWVWNVKYNHVHDQLLLSCSSDARCILHGVQSLSSEATSEDLNSSDDADANECSEPPIEDGVVKVYDEHEESVYCAEWSTSEPWIFATLSYDGRVIINKVPRATKYQILQLD